MIDEVRRLRCRAPALRAYRERRAMAEMRRSIQAPAIAILTILGAIPATAAGTDSSERLRCTPATLRAGDTLTLRMPTPHGGDLGVWTPGGTFFFLVFWASGDVDPARSLVPWDVFRSMPDLRIPTTLMAIPWSQPGPERPVFSEAGEYRFVLDESLQTDGIPRFSCRVRFSAGQR